MSPFWRRTTTAAGDPWLALTAAFGGGLAWAVGMGPAGFLVGAGMYAAGAVVGALTRGGKDEPETGPALPQLRRNTEQARLVDAMRAYVDDLRKLREGPKPDAVVDPSIEALVATENAYGTAVRVAAAIDGLDVALSRSAATQAPGREVRSAIVRMADRRTALLAKLHETVDEVAEVYTKLLEMTATVQALDVGAGATDEVERVSLSLDSLRTSLAELEAQARPSQEPQS